MKTQFSIIIAFYLYFGFNKYFSIAKMYLLYFRIQKCQIICNIIFMKTNRNKVNLLKATFKQIIKGDF